MSVPPGAPPASSLPHGFRARRKLKRLQRELNRAGWATELRDEGTFPMLRVRSPAVECIGDSIRVTRGPHGWHYWSSTGELLASCRRPDLAAERAAALLTPWIATALTPRGDEPV
ncbi:hypothetical protein [Actinomadura hibisca]|uniref:hypothetical protein n=1 Tax=Actinomadura hibisca TaxID=68565 RepID=UPI000A422109|nr:hypothetical protein [Actinomadura hibisca]